MVFDTPTTVPKRMKTEVALTPVVPSAITAARKIRIATTTNSSSGTTVVLYTEVPDGRDHFSFSKRDSSPLQNSLRRAYHSLVLTLNMIGI